MRDYILYQEVEDCYYYVAEILNEGQDSLLMVEKELVEKGYVITEVQGIFIKCTKVEFEKGE